MCVFLLYPCPLTFNNAVRTYFYEIYCCQFKRTLNMNLKVKIAPKLHEVVTLNTYLVTCSTKSDAKIYIVYLGHKFSK